MPSIETGGVSAAVVGLLAGGGFIYVADQLLPHLHSECPDEATTEGPRDLCGDAVIQRLAR
ncbi:MAG: hypothetical protein ACRD3G_04610 [Vicinamibacterales bacterium]